jgi:dihydroxyacid dehydratase/phosphogluconate dehydratase
MKAAEFVEEGDTIRIDIPHRRLELDVPDEVLAKTPGEVEAASAEDRLRIPGALCGAGDQRGYGSGI